MKLRIGKIPYANLFPIFYSIERCCDCSSYQFIEGFPSGLNKMIRDGLLDISPSSSIEFLRHPSLYRIIDGHSISSRGPIRSILLISHKPFEQLNGNIINVSYQSETSIALLKIILIKFYRIRCELVVSKNPEDLDNGAFLLIGDDALIYAIKNRAKTLKSQNINIKENQEIKTETYIYDLGEIWHKKTGLPFVYALWIVRNEIFNSQRSYLINRFIDDLNNARDYALKNLSYIVKYSSLKEYMSEEEILSYWGHIDYNLNEEHKEGLKLFKAYLKEINYLI